MKLKRLLCGLLILVVGVCAISFTVSATQSNETTIASKSDYMSNPLYPDTYTPPVYYSDTTDTAEPEVYHTTIEAAAEELRGLMEDRVTSIAIGYQTSSSDYDVRLAVLNEAFAHTGVPTQGDYLNFQYGGVRYGYSCSYQNGIYYLTLTYEISYYTTAQQEAQMDTAVDALLDELNVYDASDYEKICAVYDYMCENITYDYDGLDIYNQDNTYKKIYTAYAALIDETAVCQGYANLFYRLALELGVDARIISGIGNGGGHAWNIVELDGLYYDVDATWDASWKQSGLDYEYYLRCDANFEEHTRDDEYLTYDFAATYPMDTADYTPPVILYSGSCGKNLIWTLDNKGLLTISGAGEMYDYAPWYDYKNSIKNVIIKNGVSTICDYAFNNCKNLTEITIPDSITAIGDYAFINCTRLTYNIYDNAKYLGNSSNPYVALIENTSTQITSCEIHPSTKVISVGAFADCVNLTSVFIPDNIITVGHSAFVRCYSLSGIWVSNNNLHYSNDNAGVLFNKDKTVLIMAPTSISNSYTIPDSVNTINIAAFSWCIDLTNVVIPNSVTTIGDNAFTDCTRLSSVEIPDSVTSIGYSVFSYCSSLTTVTIPNNVTAIGDLAFYSCADLATVIFDGMQKQWEAITVGEFNEPLENATVLYIGEIKLSNAAPTLYDNIAMNYKVDKARFDELGITNPYLVVSFNGEETTITNYTISEDGTQYVFTFYNIAPNQMDDTLTATLYATYSGGVYKGATLEYSVATYCYRMLNNSTVVSNDTYAELRTLLVDLLHYGAAAQTFTGYEGELVDARLTEIQLAWGTATDPTLKNKTVTNYVTVESPTAAWASVGLVLEDAVTMRLKFTAAGITGLTVKITSDTNSDGWVINADDFQYEESTGRYYVDFGGLHAGQMRECVYVTVYEGDTAISNTLCYAVESYAYRYANSTAYPTLAELVNAMMCYGDAAYAFAN